MEMVKGELHRHRPEITGPRRGCQQDRCPAPGAPDIGIGTLFMFNTDLLWFMIPMKIFRAWADRHFLAMIPGEAEKNLSRLASQWTEGVNDAIVRMRREAETHIRDQTRTVASLLSRTESEAGGIRAALGEIESLGKASGETPRE
ncbi:MAG: hypothetical protein JXP48_04290 [Acidobacteria bacterium]|nr:hypothetical protein [Acidobacteriota bacterium]